MSSAPPTLAYAPPSPPKRLRIFVGVLLLLWSAFDVLCGTGLLLVAWASASMGDPSVWPIVAAGLLVLVFAVAALMCGVDILEQRSDGIFVARNFTRVAEWLCWSLFIFVAGDRILRWLDLPHGTLLWFFPATLCIAAAVTVTRFLLTRLARAKPT